MQSIVSPVQYAVNRPPDSATREPEAARDSAAPCHCEAATAPRSGAPENWSPEWPAYIEQLVGFGDDWS